jgi:hypothetical protein
MSSPSVRKLYATAALGPQSENDVDGALEAIATQVHSEQCRRAQVIEGKTRRQSKRASTGAGSATHSTFSVGMQVSDAG